MRTCSCQLYICVHVRIYAYMYVHMRTCTYLCVHIRTYTYMYVYIRTCSCPLLIASCTSAYIYVHIRICTYMYVHVRTCTFIGHGPRQGVRMLDGTMGSIFGCTFRRFRKKCCLLAGPPTPLSFPPTPRSKLPQWGQLAAGGGW